MIIFVSIGVLAGALGGFVLWASLASRPGSAALAAMRGDGRVEVRDGSWITFLPRGAPPKAGVIFYPGGRVDPRAYAPILARIAAEGYLVMAARMPLNLAILGIGKASEAMALHPEIDDWILGGHSLGGAMAAQYVKTREGSLDGLFLWASFPPDSCDLSGSSLSVLSLSAELDGLSTHPKIEASRPRLPPGTRFSVIAGGNHTQFGDYPLQKGDRPAVIDPEAEMDAALAATLQFLEGAAARASASEI